MDVHTNIPLRNFTTMKLGGPAKFFADARSVEDAMTLYKNAQDKGIPVFILGGGSNLIAKDDGFNGLIIHIKIPGFDIIADDASSTTIKIGAGEIWDDIVKRTVDMNLTGIEAMSFIPGTAGATPVQNVGAYGQEIADTLVSLEAIDTTTHALVTLQNQECGFSYRDSIFRGDQINRYIITSITLKLSKNQPTPPFYSALQTYLDDNNITFYTTQIIRDAVIAVRSSKLPAVDDKASAGSFFKNAIVEKWRLDEIKKTYPDIPSFDMGNDTFKVPSGWLIDRAGLKGEIINGIRIYDKNALVLVNESAQQYEDLALARDTIIAKIRDTFQITIEQEPLEI